MKHIESKVRRYHERFRPDRQSFDAWNRAWNGFKATGISIVFDTRIDDPSEGGRELYTTSRARNNLGNQWCTGESGFRSCGTVGYGPTMWVKSRKRGDVLHDHVSKACQRITGQLCWQHRWYQGRGTKRTIFLLVASRRTNRQSSRPSVVTEMSSTIVTQSCWHSCTPRCLHKKKNITA